MFGISLTLHDLQYIVQVVYVLQANISRGRIVDVCLEQQGGLVGREKVLSLKGQQFNPHQPVPAAVWPVLNAADPLPLYFYSQGLSTKM